MGKIYRIETFSVSAWKCRCSFASDNTLILLQTNHTLTRLIPHTAHTQLEVSWSCVLWVYRENLLHKIKRWFCSSYGQKCSVMFFIDHNSYSRTWQNYTQVHCTDVNKTTNIRSRLGCNKHWSVLCRLTQPPSCTILWLSVTSPSNSKIAKLRCSKHNLFNNTLKVIMHACLNHPVTLSEMTWEKMKQIASQVADCNCQSETQPI